MPLESSMKTSFYFISTLIIIAVFLTLVLFGHTELRAAQKTATEKGAQAKQAFQRLSDLISIVPPHNIDIKCMKEGGIYRYEITVTGLTLLFQDREKSVREISAVPVLKYKEKKALDARKTSVTLQANEPRTLGAGLSLDFVLISSEPPTIYRPGKSYSGYLLNKQSLVLNNVKITVNDISYRKPSISLSEILRGGSNTGICTISLELKCRDDSARLEMPECAGGSCEHTVALCNIGVSVRLNPFEDKQVPCYLQKPKVSVETTNIDAPAANWNETVIIAFCRSAGVPEDCTIFGKDVPEFVVQEELEHARDNFLGTTEPLEVSSPKNYFVEECLER
ncbi:MAG: hypothetical protein HY518_00320 [Candidatus Aenigmarchaeota archaeon]|nr:hypothetical protein [Candidatus Aenigmarchaeota archaeon]